MSTNESASSAQKGKKEIIRTVKYALIAASAGIIQEATFQLFQNGFHWKYWISYGISLALSVIWNFTINRKYTFKSANNVPIAMLKVAAYYAVFTPVTMILGNYLVETLGMNSTLIQVLTMLLNFITEFLYQRFFVFGKSIDTNAKAQAQAEKENNPGKAAK